MNQHNPYLQTYFQSFQNHNHQLTKQHFFTLATNLGHVHNALGYMISDIIKLMGNLSFGQKKNQSEQNINLNKKQQLKQKNNIKNKPKEKITKSSNNNDYKPEKMQIQKNQPNPQANRKNQQSKSIIDFDLAQFLFESQQKPRQNNQQKYANSFYKDLFQLNESKNSSQNSIKRSNNLKDQNSSQKTQSIQILRYDQKQKKLAATRSFQQLNKYNGEKNNNQNQYKVNIKQPKVQKNKQKKQKTPFFELFDSSQTHSYQPEQDYFDMKKPVEQRKIQQKLYPQTQLIEDSNNSNKSNKNFYSTQFNNEKHKENLKPNPFIKNNIKNNNLLEQTFWNSPIPSKMFEVEEIDEIQTTEKKPNPKIKFQQKKEERQFESNQEQYIPRREQKGRKKSDRQDLKGSECPDCKAFYDAVSNDGKSFGNMCECSSRHKSSTTFMRNHKVQNFSQDFKLG